MKKIISLVTVFVALALGTNALAAPFAFTAGSIVIYRVGDGTQPLTNTGNSVFLDEYRTNDIWAAAGGFTPPTLVQSIQMPTNWVGAQAPLIADGTAFAEGALSLSSDGRFLVLTGYGATLGQLIIGPLGSASTMGQVGQLDVARVVGLVDGFGHIDTTTAQINANENGDEIRSAVSTDGTDIWLAGASRGVKYTTQGSMLSIQVLTAAANVRVLGINNNTLCFTANGRVGSATAPCCLLPKGFVANNFANLPGVLTSGNGSPFGFALFNLNGGAAPDTLYVADNTTNAPGEPWGHGGGVLKYCYIPARNAWVNFGYIYAQGATWLTGVQNGTNVDLYITEGGTATPNALNVLYPYHDVSGFAGSPQTNPDGGDANGNAEPLAPPGVDPALINTRGIAFAPQGGDSGSLTGPGVISIGPPYSPNFSGPAGGPFTPANFVYSVANLGTNTTNWTLAYGAVPWITASAANGALPPGGSITVTLTPNANATNEVGGYTYSGNISFHTGNALGSTAATVTPSLTVYAFYVTPSSDFVATGSVGGPFTPSSYVYTLSNATAGALSWNAYTSDNWNSLSATGGSLPGLATTNIAVSINTNANSLSVGVYQDTLVFSNLSANAQLPISPGVILQVGFGIFDDFSTYTQNVDLVDQNNWFARDTTATLNPLQVSGGAVTQPGGCNPPDTTSQEAWKNFSQGNITNTSADTPYLYAGMLITVNSAAPIADGRPNYTLSFYQSLGKGYATGNLSMTDVDGSVFTFNCQVNNGAGIVQHSSVYRLYGVMYEVYLVVDAGDSNAFVFVNPPDGSNIFSNTPEAADQPVGFPAGYDPGMGSIQIGNYCNGVSQEGFTIAKLAVSTNYADVYNFLNVPPPVASFTATPTTGAAPLAVNFTDTSSNSPTSWYWTFGDGNSSTSEYPANTYTNPGAYTVSLIASNAVGSSTSTATITVYDPFTWWQQGYGLTNNCALCGGSASYTGDGMSNTNKFLAGFNPTNAAAYLHIISIVKTNGTDIKVTYLGASGNTNYPGGPTTRTNVLDYTTGTANGSYTNSWPLATQGVQTNTLTGGTGLGTVTNMTDAGGATNSPARYYRVRVLVP